jgi:hypothetical protein
MFVSYVCHANAGVIVLVIINDNAAAMPMITGSVVRCMIIESYHIAILIGTLNLFTIKQIHNTRHYQLRVQSSEYAGFKWVVCLHDLVHYEKVYYTFKESELYP